MIETKYTKTLYKAIRKLNLDKEELKGLLLCLYLNGCSSNDCARLFGIIEEKVIKFLESEDLYNYKACNTCGKLKDRENDFHQLKTQKNMICKDCKCKYVNKYYENNKEEKDKYNKEYYKNNKEKIQKYKKEYNKEYRENNKEEINKYSKQHYEDNKDKILEHHKTYYENNKEEILEHNKQYKKNNKEEHLAYNKQYYENNKEERLKYHKKHNQSNASVEQVQKLAMYEKVSGNQIRCKYCGKWMTPTVIQIRNRLQGIKESDKYYIYCSEECKQECPVYNQSKYPKGFKPASSREVNPVLRQIVLERDEYTCQKCHKSQDELTVGLHCHHITPYADSPIETDDPENCITLCKDCHNIVHKIPGCGYHELRCEKIDD